MENIPNWFPDVAFNFAELVLNGAKSCPSGYPILSFNEKPNSVRKVSFDILEQSVHALATYLRVNCNLCPGDVVAGSS